MKILAFLRPHLFNRTMTTKTERSSIKILAFLLAGLGLLTAACTSTATSDNGGLANGADAQSQEVAQAVSFGEGPAMWRMADADSEIYLFGTFHLLPAGLQWTTPTFDAAMLETEITFTEADNESPEAVQAIQSAVQRLGLNPPGVTLSSTLGPERAAEFAAVAQQYGVPAAQLEPLRPWLAILSLTQVAFQQAGYDPQAGAETTILARANSEMDTLGHFETAVSQIEALASLDMIGEFANTDESLDQLTDFGGFAEQMLAIWQTGDVDRLDAELVGSVRDSSEEAFDIIFKNRNANWVEQIEVMMAGEGDYFLAVGAGHLVGKDSVVDMLRSRGYTVTRVQ
ncbi:MAG: TraB/GumN family protein [Pseudomonadota bacterium]